MTPGTSVLTLARRERFTATRECNSTMPAALFGTGEPPRRGIPVTKRKHARICMSRHGRAGIQSIGRAVRSAA